MAAEEEATDSADDDPDIPPGAPALGGIPALPDEQELASNVPPDWPSAVIYVRDLAKLYSMASYDRETGAAMWLPGFPRVLAFSNRGAQLLMGACLLHEAGAEARAGIEHGEIVYPLILPAGVVLPQRDTGPPTADLLPELSHYVPIVCALNYTRARNVGLEASESTAAAILMALAWAQGQPFAEVVYCEPTLGHKRLAALLGAIPPPWNQAAFQFPYWLTALACAADAFPSMYAAGGFVDDLAQLQHLAGGPTLQPLYHGPNTAGYLAGALDLRGATNRARRLQEVDLLPPLLTVIYRGIKNNSALLAATYLGWVALPDGDIKQALVRDWNYDPRSLELAIEIMLSDPLLYLAGHGATVWSWTPSAGSLAAHLQTEVLSCRWLAPTICAAAAFYGLPTDLAWGSYLKSTKPRLYEASIKLARTIAAMETVLRLPAGCSATTLLSSLAALRDGAMLTTVEDTARMGLEAAAAR